MPIFFPRCHATLSVVFDGFGPEDDAPQIVQVPVRSASVHLNSYKEADTFALDFDARELPFSPELIRNCGVQIWLFQTNGLDDDPSLYAKRENMVIAGLIDRPNSRYSRDGRTFHMEGRDYTALLIGKAWDPTKRIPVGSSLADTVQQLVDEACGVGINNRARVLTVEFRGEEDPSSFEQSALVLHGEQTIKAKAAPKAGAGRSKSKKRGIPSPHPDSTYWDIIYRLCAHAGFVVYVQLDRVIIGAPQALTEGSTPIRVAYGRNLASLEIDRSMGKESVPQIVATSYDPKTRKTLEARWPDSASSNPFAHRLKVSAKGKLSGIGTSKDETLRVDAPFGITDVELLRRFARMYYITLARGESKVRFSTKFLRDLSGLDMLKARQGMAVVIGFDPFNSEELRVLPAATREQRLVSMGYDHAIARLVAEEFDKIKQFTRPRRVREISFEYSNEDGVAIEVDANQFVFVERDGD